MTGDSNPHEENTITRTHQTVGLLICLAVFVGLLLSVTSPGLGECAELPLWEAGAGLSVLNIPDYRGSDEQRFYVFPIPYLIYRGEALRIDGQRVRELLFQSEAIQLDLSLNASVPVNSSGNKARQGMPDLDPTVEIGPSLEILLARNREGDWKVTVTMPVRAVFAVNLSRIREVGWISNPRINIDFFDVGPGKLDVGLGVGPVFADRLYHRYFYGVEPADALPDRPAFSASGGYSGTQIALSATRRFAKIWLGAFIRADILHNAAFSKSPLLKTRESVMGGIALSWIFAQSHTLVKVDE